MTKVLVVDDAAAIRLLCRVTLAAEGWTVVEAPDGVRGLDTAQQEQPDAILLDMMMPGLNGLQVAETLSSDPATAAIPIIFLTAKVGFVDQLRGYEAGGIDYVTKPFNPMTIASVVRGALDRAAAPDTTEAERLTRIEKLRILSQLT